jgi:hypothetical protein
VRRSSRWRRSQAERLAFRVISSVSSPAQLLINTADGINTTILVAHQLILQQQTALKLKFNMKFVVKRVANGKITAPTYPIPFLEMAKEVVEWLEAPKP